MVETALVDWSRLQFALTAGYHWLFVPLTLGLAVIMATMETIYVKTGDEFWKRTAKFWMKLFAINFAVGIATGIILEFEFGTNWSNYSWFVGDIFGAPLAIEGIFAFFMEATFFAVAFDRRGRLGWQSGRIVDDDPGYGGAHIIEVLCEGASPEYLSYLQSIGVSYIFAGEENGELDLALALFKLRRIFGIKKLLLEGGSILNGAFQREDMVDELSLVVMPCVAEEGDKPLFWQSALSEYRLEESGLVNGAPWLRYVRKR